MFLGLGLPEWLTIIGLIGGLVLTFFVMAKASVRYEEARKARELREQAAEHRSMGSGKGSEDETGHTS